MSLPCDVSYLLAPAVPGPGPEPDPPASDRTGQRAPPVPPSGALLFVPED
jgi:hypothetical protein